MYHNFDYEMTLASSAKAAWALDDVLRADQRLDFEALDENLVHGVERRKAGRRSARAILTGSASAWTDNDITAGLAPGTTYTIKLINNSASGAIKVDDIWLWFVPMTRSAMAARVHNKIGRLATERSYSTTPSSGLTEGTYTYAVDAGLRAVGAINPETGLPDARYLDEENIQTALDFIEREILEQLQRDYSVEVDVRVGQRQESLSQISKALGETVSSGSKGGGRIVTRKLTHDGDRW